MENNNIFIDLEVQIILIHNYFFQIFGCCSNHNATPFNKKSVYDE
jgi:hypothetical protein